MSIDLCPVCLQEQQQCVLSLGFHAWCAIGIELECLQIGDKEYLTIHKDLKATECITAMFNFELSEELATWASVKVRLLPPSCLPVGLVNNGIAFEVIRKDGWILKDALRSGIALTVEQLRQACQSVGADLPAKKEGSGSKGAIVKVDYARALIAKVFADETEECRELLLKNLGVVKRKPLDVSVLAAISELDAENAGEHAFRNMKERAMQMFEETVYGEGVQKGLDKKLDREKDEGKRAANYKEAAERADQAVKEHKTAEQKHVVRQFELTPPDLKQLLPGAGEISGVFYARYNPIAGWFSAQYPIGGCAVPVLTVLSGLKLQTNSLSPKARYGYILHKFVFVFSTTRVRIQTIPALFAWQAQWLSCYFFC